jgi:hypothetical protein
MSKETGSIKEKERSHKFNPRKKGRREERNSGFQRI